MKINLSLVAAFLLSSSASFSNEAQPLRKTPLSLVSFSDLNGWNNEQAKAAKPALLNSCEKLSMKVFNNSPMPIGSYQQWQNICHQLAQEKEARLKIFFENNFNVYRVDAANNGLFTGYYSPVYEGRLKKEKGFDVPILKYPNNKTGNSLKNDDSRRIIEKKIKTGVVKSRQVLAWLKSPVDKFFLQIQGSGNIQLQDNTILYIGYAGSNGKNYVAIGKVLKEQKELDEVSMSTIKSWLATNPEKQQELFNKNPRYIFFRTISSGAITAQGVPAMAHRTLAVDPKYIPYGIPLWVDTLLTHTAEPYRKMMIAQDTGNAIKGSVRGDIYMGVGNKAAALAGVQKAAGKLYVFLPKKYH